MVTSQGPSTMPSELMSQTICTFQILSMIGTGNVLEDITKDAPEPLGK